MEIELKGVVDVGNSEHGSFIDEEMMLQPSTISKLRKKPFYEDLDLSVVMAKDKLFEELVVEIDSPEIKTSAMYSIGQAAIEGQRHYTHTNLRGSSEEKGKRFSDVPIIMTVATFAARAVQKAYKNSGELPTAISLTADMITGLPVREYNQSNAQYFAERFTKHQHNVKVLLGAQQSVEVAVNFDFVKVFPEASTAMWAIWKDRKKEVRTGYFFKEFEEAYAEKLKLEGIKEVDGSYFIDKRVLHMDIGEGTTEFPITNGLVPDQKMTNGSDNGIGYAIESILEEYRSKVKLNKAQRHNVSKVLKDKKHKYHKVAMELIEGPLEGQAEDIVNAAAGYMTDANNEIDVVVVYGGGSILLKEYLYPALLEECEDRGIMLLYIPETDAATLYLEGLNVILTNGAFDALKKKALETSKG
ncbi:ParM/StbA family protein [Priestia filamentosa]|uniref:hypothetical protein n=1 Tax=Priestia filamentosa TaxID=1402861 RepID=UPI0039827E3D